MEYCGPIGLKHSQFLSWPEEDQDSAIAWMIHKRSQCPGCGTFAEEWVDEDGRELWPPPYHASATRCFGCATIEEERKKLPEGRELQYRLHLTPQKGSEDE